MSNGDGSSFVGAIPKWMIFIALVAILLFMGVSFYYGKTFKVMGYEFGFAGRMVANEPSKYMSPHQGGKVVTTDPTGVCQVVRFWTPSSEAKLTLERPFQEIQQDLHTSITREFRGWTRWSVSGSWRDPDTGRTYYEDGNLYEVGIYDCEQSSVERLHKIVARFVKNEMKQISMYFAATKFDKMP